MKIPHEPNIIFITLDSCRWDTFQKAKTPFLDSIGKAKKAITYGTFTNPAHAAFFGGFLPNVFEEKEEFYSFPLGQIWKLNVSTKKKQNAKINMTGNTILDAYEKKNYFVLGVGGVKAFHKSGVLRKFFKHFIYFGVNKKADAFDERKNNQFALNHNKIITNRLKHHNKFFLFLNCMETHYPYDFGDGLPKEILDYKKELESIVNLRENNVTIPEKIFTQLKRMQISSLEAADTRIERLFSALPKHRDLLVIICGDHGENIGETYQGKKRLGHLIPTNQIFEVPLIIGVIKKSKNSLSKLKKQL